MSEMRRASRSIDASEKRRRLLTFLKRLADKVSLQYALFVYIYLRRRATFDELYRVYNDISGKVVRCQTVRNQLKMLERKGLVRRVGDVYVALVDPREVVDLFDVERSRSGRIGGAVRHLKLGSRSLRVPPGLSYYVGRVVEEARKLVRSGRREVALDLIAHTLLPLRENEVLWLWHGDLFVYYSPKVHQFRAVRSEEVAKLLKKLGFEEGVMIYHTLGHEEASKIVRSMFNRGPYSWPWARSVAYGLKMLGLLREVDALYKIELRKDGARIVATLYDLYTKQKVCEYGLDWSREAPEPLKGRSFVVATVLGKQHVKKEIEECSYFSKWRS